MPASRVTALVDADAVSHGRADWTAADRASDAAVARCLALVDVTAWALVGRPPDRAGAYRLRCAASTKTTLHHLGVVAAAGNNIFAVRRGLNGADGALLELQALTAARMTTSARRRKPIDRVDVVLLVAQDRIYAPAVRQLRLVGVLTWVLQPGRYIAAELYRAAAAVTQLAPELAA